MGHFFVSSNHTEEGDTMQHQEIITHLTNLDVNPSEIIYAISMQSVIVEIVNRLGECTINSAGGFWVLVDSCLYRFAGMAVNEFFDQS
jgi:hypothetical protein